MEEDNDFDFDDFLENSNNDFDQKLEKYKDAMISAAINENYHNIMSQGISDWHIRMMEPSEVAELMETFRVMVSHFEELEEFEKCAMLVKQQKKINQSISLRQDI
mgnify:FL=1|jgi:hypothetical protein|tara:strand:+ start:1026 stop:1340 length:315 start_codon:yes stop_codon:yes gene_type:complete